MIKKKEFKSLEFVVGASEGRDLCVEYPNVCCFTLDDVRQFFKSCNDVVHARVVLKIGSFFCVFKKEG